MFKHYDEDRSFVDKSTALSDYLAPFMALPRQGSAQWLANRCKTIGGSEMSILEGTNPYKDLKGLVMVKLGWDKFEGNIATNWGKVFEPVTQRILELLFKCELFESGSLPGCIEGTSYSPDGFAVVLKDTITDLISKGWIEDHELPEESAVCILFEIKSPYKRIPNGIVPIMYMSQPKSGLCHFPFVDIAYFVDVAYRKCSCDAESDAYDNDFHKDKMILQNHFTYGFIGIYNKNASYDVTSVPLNYGNIRYYGMLEMTNNIDNRTWAIWMGEPHWDIDNQDEIIAIDSEWFAEFCEKNDYSAIGHMMYKGYLINILPVQRDPDFVQNLAPEVRKVLSVVDKVKKAANQQEEFDKIFTL